MAGATCRVCELENAEGARFCSACGATLTVEKGGDALVGKTIAGKFRIEKLLGNGAMGRVYKATDLGLDRGVALKVMHDHLARSGEFATRFVREARAAARLDHPNSIRVLAFGRTEPAEGQLLYLVMELFVGTDLYGLLRDEGPIDIPRGVRIVTQVLSALEDAHAQKLIHRDLKPENVLVGKRADGSEIAKLCDFGIAKIAQQEGPKLSQDGHMIGTPLYMSPEAACGREADARSDLYSLGILLYEVVTGSWPFDAPSPLEVARMQVEEPPEPPTRRAPERKIPLPIERIILRSIAKKPEDRFQSARDFRIALEGAIGIEGRDAAVATTPCASCGSPVPLQSRFCPSCGRPRTASASRMPEVKVPEPAATDSKGGTGPVDKGFSTLAGLVPDRLLGDLRKASLEARSERRTLAVLAIDLIGIDDAGDPEELAGRIGDRFELCTRILERFAATIQGGGGARMTALFGVGARTPSETESLVAQAVEAAFAIRHECGGARWFKGGIAHGIFLLTANATGTTILGAAAQTAGRNAELAQPGEIVLDETIRTRVGEGFTTMPSRAGLYVVREDFANTTSATVGRSVIGRDAELDVIIRATRESLDGRGQVIAIRGEAGIGKTALVREAIQRMRDLPIRWYRVACQKTGMTNLGAVRDLILTYTGVGRGAPPEIVRQSLGGDRGTLATLGLASADQHQLVGLLLSASLSHRTKGEAWGSAAAGSSSGSSSGVIAPDIREREGGAAIRNFLAAALRKGGVGFIVEDLQWIDAASAALLAQVASAIAKRPALLILTARAGIWSDWNAPHFQRIQLGPLDAATTTRVLATMLPDGEVPAAVAQPILQRASGNPLFLEAIVEALRASGALQLQEGRYSIAEGAKLVAEGLRGLVEARLRALDTHGQRMLLLASVAGSEVDLGDLQALAGGDINVEIPVGELIKRGLLEERARSQGSGRRVGFSNEGVREVLYDMLAVAERRAVHAALAERWEAIRAATKIEPAPLEELARHWELAGEHGPAAARLEDAALVLLARGEHKSASALLTRAANYASALDPKTGTRIVLTLADALAQTGDTKGVEAALALLTSLKLDVQERAIADAKGNRSRGTAHRRGGRAADAAVVIERALDAATSARDFELACDLHLDLSGAFEEVNETQRALQMALAGLEMASKLAEKQAPGSDDGPLRLRLANYLNAIGRLYLRRDDAVRAADYFRGSLAQAEKIRDAGAAARALANLGHIAARRDDFRAASAESTRALRLAQNAGDRLAQARIHVNLGHYLAKLGRIEEAQESYRAAQTLAEAIGWSEGVAIAHQSLDAVGRAQPAG